MRPVIYFILLLACITGVTWLLTQNGCAGNTKATDIYSNVKDTASDAAGSVKDAASDLLEDSDGETAPPDEFNDAAATSTDVDGEDDDIIPLSGDDTEEDDEGYAASDDGGADEDYSDSKEVIGGAYTEGSGDYMVIAGAFSVKDNANGVLDKIRSLGYPQAEVVKFDYSDYYSVCVARYETNRDAKKIADSLKSRYDVKAYVHKRRSKRG